VGVTIAHVEAVHFAYVVEIDTVHEPEYAPDVATEDELEELDDEVEVEDGDEVAVEDLEELEDLELDVEVEDDEDVWEEVLEDCEEEEEEVEEIEAAAARTDEVIEATLAPEVVVIAVVVFETSPVAGTVTMTVTKCVLIVNPLP